MRLKFAKYFIKFWFTLITFHIKNPINSTKKESISQPAQICDKEEQQQEKTANVLFFTIKAINSIELCITTRSHIIIYRYRQTVSIFSSTLSFYYCCVSFCKFISFHAENTSAWEYRFFFHILVFFCNFLRVYRRPYI